MSFWKKIKRWFGFAGVKVELDTNVEVKRDAKEVSGNITITSKEEAEVIGVKVTVEESYTYKKGDTTKTKKYTLAEWTHEGFTMSPESTKELKFKTAFDFELGRGSDMSHESGVLGGLGKLAKMAKGAKSEFRMYAVVDVKGVALDPNATQKLTITSPDKE